AYSGIANIDIFMCLLIFWFVCVCQIYLKHPTLKNSIFFGIITGLSFAVKSSAVIEIIIMLSFMVIHYCKTNEPEENAGIIDFIEMRFRKLSVSFIVALIILLTSYFFVGIPEYLNGLKDIASGILKGKTNIFFAGLYSMNGFWFYYFGVYLLKTASPEILLALIFIFYIFKHSILIKYPELFNFIIAAVIIFFAISLSNFQTGMRYMLPVYPILAVFLGVTSSFMIKLKGKSRMFLFILTLWMSVSSFNTHPDYLAYFNELTSLSADGKNNSNLLADCNVDWGQDLKKLKTRLNKYPNSFLVFSYFGNDDPEEYRIEYLELAPRTRIKLNPKTPQYFDKNRILLAVSKTNFTGVYYPGDMDLFAWLKILEPVENIGNSILVYDITNSKIALQKIIEIYEIQNKTKEMEILRFFLSKINS
ncbi:MAG TPA: hypothetical protein PLQ81_09290, partial [bacterium]|nr:hypothetical protein [bacterium]